MANNESPLSAFGQTFGLALTLVLLENQLMLDLSRLWRGRCRAFNPLGVRQEMETPVNPYESPEATGGQRPVLGVYHARLMPRDAIDWVLGFSIGLLLSGALYGSAAVVCWLLSFPPLVGIVMVLLAACLAFLLGIRSVWIGDTGVVVRRVFGGSRHLAWQEIRALRVATRWEVLYFGLLFPWRICTMSLTFRDQYRIELCHGCFIFPPKECQPFADAIHARLMER